MQQPGLPPRYSDDGRWYWDGQRWIPTTQTGPLAVGSGTFGQYAGFWLRFLAYLIDGVILAVGGFVVGFILGLVAIAVDFAASGSSKGSGMATSIASLLSWTIGLVGGWLYFSLQESSARQATVGKLVLGIRVVDLQGKRLSFARATGRYFAKILSGLICFVGFVMAGLTERKQALHDMVASTLVVRTHPVNAQQLQPGGAASTRTAVIMSLVAAGAILALTSIVVIVILLTMGGQLKNVFSNVAVALNGP